MPRVAAETGGGEVANVLRYGAGLLRRHGLLLALVFAGLLLPLWVFGELADEIHEQEAIAFDEPILQFAHTMAREGFNEFFVFVSKIGYAWGVVPFDIAFVLVLAVLRRYREAVFSAIALGGSGLLNVGAKLFFARDRPSLWESIAPESTYSFPSGHAMGSMTLACVLVLLAWHTRWRWAVLALMVPFVVLVGLSRVYLGVHYPSDIVAGWSVAVAWVAAVYLAVYRVHGRPWKRREISPDAD